MKNLLILALALPIAACSASETPVLAASELVTAAENSEPLAIETSLHNVKCGCAIDSVGECGEYVEFDGKYAPLSNYKDLGLSPMEWCHKEGLQAEVAGTLVDGVFVATAVEVKE